jgi:hypothetical protein
VTTLALLAQADAPNAAAGGAFFGNLLALGAVFWVLALAATVFWLWMLVDVLTSSKDTTEKILWFLVVFFLHFVGAVVYFLVARSPRAGTAAVT